MPDLRELIDDPEESLRAALAGLQGRIMTTMPGIVSADSPDGHTGTIQPAVKRAVADAVHNQITYQDFPLLPDVPIHFPGGGGMTLTHAVKAGDEIITAFSSHAFDFWHQSGGTQQPAMDRQHSATDAIAIPGIRSDPRKLHQVSTESAQLRSDDKKSVIDQHPTAGTHIKNVDPSTPAASATFDPFTAATKFFEHLIHPTGGHAQNATDGGTTHSITNTHADGPKLAAKNGDHTVQAHPDNGVSIASTVAHLISAPNASLDGGGNLSVSGNSSASGTVSGAAGAFAGGISLGDGGSGGTMTSTNLGGDLAGTLDDAQVVSLAHVTGLQALPQCADDGAATAAGVAVGGLYLSAAITITTGSSGGSGGTGSGGSGSASSSTTIPAGLLRVRLT